ncbi:cytochrome P450 [Parachaetomium inaequale]|uniref:Cytochrome P450 n=1 Tax=Parachaetomium inaequale TaxID=2588326 RepID=A0AAN6PAX0_9PEZI|nr:cytochrome P450 [Parachaetomium inaequale]
MAFNITTKMTIPVFSGLSSHYYNLVEQFQVMQQALAPLNLTKWQLARLLAAQVWRDTSPLLRTTLLVIFIGSLILAIDAYIIQPYFLSLRRLGVPELKPTNGRHAFDYKPMLEEAAQKYPDRPWFFTYSGFELVVLPSAYVDEVRRLAARTASLVDFLTTVQFGGWKLIGTDDSSSTLHKTASTELARSVGPLGHARQQVAREAIQAVVGDAQEWKTVNLFWTVLEIVAATGAIGLVGEPLSRDPRWLRAVRTLPILVGIGVYISCFMPRLLRPLVATISYVPAWLLHKYLAHLLRPSVEKAIQESAAQTEKDREPKKPTTLIHLLLNRYKPGELDTSQLIKDVITATFESTPTTAVSLYWMLTELVLRPDLVEELRSELLSVLAPSGTLPPTQLTELAKMDSFMRESARVNTFHYLGLNRILQHDFQFSIGPRLPKGTIICVDQHHIHTSPELYENPEEFDALRFYRKRQQQGHETRHQYASNGPELLTWGDGPQACPGRVFATNTIKILLAELLLNYDLQMPAGAYKPERRSFPNGSSQPDMDAQLMARRMKLK